MALLTVKGVSLVGVVVLVLALVFGQLLGNAIGGFFGDTLLSTLVSVLVVGGLAYLLFTFTAGGKLGLIPGVLFIFMVYLVELLVGAVSDMLGLALGVFSIVIAGVILGLVWPLFAGMLGNKRVRIRKK